MSRAKSHARFAVSGNFTPSLRRELPSRNIEISLFLTLGPAPLNTIDSFLFRKSVFRGTLYFLRQTRSFLPSVHFLPFRCEKVETYDKSIGQVRPEKKAFNGYISFPGTSRFNDDTESAKFPRYLTILPLSDSIKLVFPVERGKAQKVVYEKRRIL